MFKEYCISIRLYKQTHTCLIDINHELAVTEELRNFIISEIRKVIIDYRIETINQLVIFWDKLDNNAKTRISNKSHELFGTWIRHNIDTKPNYDSNLFIKKFFNLIEEYSKQEKLITEPSLITYKEILNMFYCIDILEISDHLKFSIFFVNITKL